MIFVRIVLSESSEALLLSMAELIDRIEQADEALLEDGIREACERLKEALLAPDALHLTCD